MATTTQMEDLQQDDVALADRMNRGRQQIVTELKKLIIGQDEVVGQVLLTLWEHGPISARDVLAHLARAGVDWSRSTVISPDVPWSRESYNASSPSSPWPSPPTRPMIVDATLPDGYVR